MVLILWIVAINVLIITFFKYQTIDYLNRETRLYINLKESVPGYHLPTYIKILNRKTKISGYSLFGVYKGKLIYVDTKYIKKGFKRFMTTLLFWEMSLSVILLLMVYFIIKRFLKKEQAHRKFLNFILGIISHKFGNFLSIQKLNLELIETDNEKPLQRLKEAYSFMEQDFSNILSTIRNTEEDKPKKYNIKQTINQCMDILLQNKEEKNIKLTLTDINIISKNSDFYNIIHELIENAVKYSKTFIHIKTAKKGKYAYIVISNDINKIQSGSGFGLELVRYLSLKNNWQFTTKLTQNTFTASLSLKL